MPFWDLLKLSLQTFRTHKMRSFLTALGIIVGVMTVISIVSLIQGMNQEVERQISSLGSNSIFVQKVAWGMGHVDFEELGHRPDLTLDDARALARLPSVDKVAPQRSRQISRIIYQGEKVTSVNVLGATPEVRVTGNYKVESGRFINSDDNRRKRPVCLAGGYIVDNLFPEENPIGKRIDIRGHRFTIVGVLERKGSFLGQSQDNLIITPLLTFSKYFPLPRSRRGRIFRSLSIQVTPKKGARVDAVIDEIRELIRRRHGLGY
ncbi:hypothetical protein CH330_01750, partial [candidate division WOR-3 bacterium JGI_Cruoil_03_51_56]